MIISAGAMETFPFAQPVGVGLVDVSIQLTRLCLLDKPDFLLFIGSAGSYGTYKPLDVAESSGAANIELSFLDGHSYTPLDNVLVSQMKNVSHETIVNSSNYITTDFAYGPKLEKHGIGLENMEFYAVVSVAREFDIPVGGLFVVTNYTDKNAHEDFKKNHKAAMAELTAALEERRWISNR